MKTEEQIREQYRLIGGVLEQRGRREGAVSEAMTPKYGRVALVHRGSAVFPRQSGRASKICVGDATVKRPLKSNVECAGSVASG